MRFFRYFYYWWLNSHLCDNGLKSIRKYFDVGHSTFENQLWRRCYNVIIIPLILSVIYVCSNRKRHVHGILLTIALLRRTTVLTTLFNRQQLHRTTIRNTPLFLSSIISILAISNPVSFRRINSHIISTVMHPRFQKWGLLGPWFSKRWLHIM